MYIKKTHRPGWGSAFERTILFVRRLNDGRYFLKIDADPIVVADDEKEVKAAADLREKALQKLSLAERAALKL